MSFQPLVSLADGEWGGVTYESGVRTIGKVRPVFAVDTSHFLFIF